MQIAIDDFGTGFSSLSYLRRLPVDIIKIDRSFVAEMRNSSTAEALVRMVIDLAKVLDLRTVAEGIEDEAQAEQLSTLLCDEGQGYFFARPQPAAEIRALFAPLTTAACHGRPRCQQLDVTVVEGDRALSDLSADIGALHAELEVPVNARLRWLQVWSSLESSWTPGRSLVRDRQSGRLTAAALLARRTTARRRDRRDGPWSVRHDASAAADLLSANVLARESPTNSATLPGPWTLTLDNLDEADLAGQLLIALLPNASGAPVASVPFVDLTDFRHGVELYTQNMRRQLRKAENRLATDGLRAELQFARTEPEIRLLLPQLDRIHIERDHAAGRPAISTIPRVVSFGGS